MKVAVLKEKQKFEIWNVAEPEIGDYDVLVRIKACCVCNGTDSKFFNGTHTLVKYPAVIGHEGAGVVERVGKSVTKVKVLDKVMGAGYSGNAELHSLWGQYSEYGVANEENVVIIPESVPVEDATLTVMLSEALNALTIGGVKPGDNILIIGAGAVGLSMLTMLKHTFPARIIVVDINPEKLKMAVKLGADLAFNAADENLLEKINEVTEGKGVNKLFEAVGSKKTYELAFDLIGKNGVIVPFGVVEGAIEIPFRKLYAKQAQVRWCNGEGDTRALGRKVVLNMMAKGMIDTNALITSRIPLENVNEAFKKIAEGTEIRVVLTI